MGDIELKTATQKFKYRVNGIIIHNGKILTLKMKNNISYCLDRKSTRLNSSHPK